MNNVETLRGQEKASGDYCKTKERLYGGYTQLMSVWN